MTHLTNSLGLRHWILSIAFIAAGANHFINTEVYLSIMPAYLPWHSELVWLSGLFEILGGLGILFAFSRRAAGIGLVLLSVAVFPANIHMALHPELYVSEDLVWLTYARLPLQLLIITWIIWATRPPNTHHTN